MPSRVGGIIETSEGPRHLLHDELAKGLGAPKDWCKGATSPTKFGMDHECLPLGRSHSLYSAVVEDLFVYPMEPEVSILGPNNLIQCYGTVDMGLELCCLVWPWLKHMFLCVGSLN